MSSTESLPMWQDARVINALLRPYYQPPEELGVPELPYHNFGHAIRSADCALKVAREFARYGIEMETDIFKLAGRGHDADYFRKVGVDNPFPSKERLSADITDKIAAILDTPLKKRATIRGVILASGTEVPCTTDTQRGFRQGDLIAGGLLDSQVAFLNNTYRLYRESKLLNGELALNLTNPAKLIKDMAQYAITCSDVLSTLIASDIDFPDLDYEKLKIPTFAARAESNLRILSPARLTTFLGSHLGEVVTFTPVSI